MSRTDEVTENPNDKQAPGKPLGPDEVAPTDDNGLEDDDGLGPVDEDEDEVGLDPQPIGDDHDSPGRQERLMTDDEKLDKALEDSFPTSDPIQPSVIDGPNN